MSGKWECKTSEMKRKAAYLDIYVFYSGLTLTLVNRKSTRSVAREAKRADWKSMNLTSTGLAASLPASEAMFWPPAPPPYLNRILDSHKSP